MPTYQMMIGEAGESCAFYIADTLGMPEEMLKVAVEAAYGKGAVEKYEFRNKEKAARKASSKITKIKKPKKKSDQIVSYNIGDSVMVSPDKKIGIVCEPMNEKGVLRVQIAGRKIWINHKRVKLLVRAEELYPEDYDFSIIFDSVEQRKLSHDMGRKFVEETLVHDSE